MDPNTRQAKRAPVTLKIKFKSATIDQFIERYAADVSPGGIFIRTKEPLAVGTQMRFEFQLRDATPLITGDGTVVWTRENDPTRPNAAPGMGVRFDRLGDGSQPVLDRILAEKAKQPSPATAAPITEPPPNKNFMDAPTRVAPSPLVNALAGESKPKMGQLAPSKSGFADERTDTTPLPRPMPFHSDADEFPDETFEEATKVRALDDLVAATAPQPEPAPAPPPAVDPAAPRTSQRMINTARAIPVMEDVEPVRAVPIPAEPPAVERPRASEPPPMRPTPAMIPASPPAVSAVSASVALPAKAAPKPAPAADEPKALPGTSSRGSSAVVMGLLLAALVAAGVWFFFLRDRAKPASAPATPGTASGTAVAALAVDAAVPTVDAAPTIDAPEEAVVTAPITIKASVPGATVTIVETGASGPAPFSTELPTGKPFTARVEAPGFAPMELPVQGGDKTASAKLEAMARVLHIDSTPSGAAIAIDGVGTGKLTPADITLTKAQGAKPTVRVSLRKRGFATWAGAVPTASYTVDGDHLVATVAPSLVAVRDDGGETPAGSGSATPTGSGSGSGSATPTGSGSGSGSATPTGSGSGSGSATPTGSGSGSATPTGSGSGSATPTGTGSGSAPTGTGSGSASGTGAGTAAGSAKPAGSGSATPPAGSGTGGPTPDWAKPATP